MAQSFEFYAIGRIRKQDGKAWIEVDAKYRSAIQGLDAFSHILLLYWLHENDNPESRSVLQVHPQNNASNPLTGILVNGSKASELVKMW